MGLFDKIRENRSAQQPIEEYSSSSAAFASLFGGSNVLNEEKIMKIPTAEACVNLITSSIAQMPIYLYKENPDGSVEKMVDDKRVLLLNQEPNEMLNGYNFKKQIVKDYLLHGGAFVSVEKLGNDVAELYPLSAKNVSFTKYIKDGYKISAEVKFSVNESGKVIKFKPYELMIALSDSPDGITSVGLIEKGEKIFQQAIDEMEYTYNIFQRGALPLGILKAEGRLSQNTVDQLRNSWSQIYGGAKNSAKTIILEEGMDYTPMSMKPSDLQLNDSKNGTNGEICKLFGVPESMISTAANKYGSIEQNNLHFLKHCLSPIIGSFENATDKSLLLEREKEEGYFFRFDTSELLRATEKERVEAVGLGLSQGLFTINEARSKLDLPVIEDDVFMWGLQNVLFNPETGEMKVPNMGLTGQENQNQSEGENQNVKTNTTAGDSDDVSNDTSSK